MLALSEMEFCPVIWHDTLDSTSSEASRLAVSGEYGPCWIAARQQSGGRGRRGSKWLDMPGNLATTLLFPFSGKAAGILAIVAGLGLIDALDLASRPGLVRLKWPNDVRWQGRKLAGILVETGSAWASIGFGVNICSAPEAGQPTECVQALPGGEGVQAEELLSFLVQSMRHRLQQFRLNQFSQLGRDWIARSETARTALRTRTKPYHSGFLTGLSEDGRLILTSACGQAVHIEGGEVFPA